MIIGLVVFLYVGFRLWNLTATCLWFDEIFSVHAAQHSWSELFSFVAQDLIHPPFFYVVLKIWISIGGESLLWLRLFPVVVSSAALVPLILLCREAKFGTPETVTAIILLAVNGSLIKYAQEVRMYSLLFCLALVSLWLFVRWLKRENVSLIPIFIVNLLLIYTHYFGWLVVLTEIIVVLFVRKNTRKWLILSGLWALSFLPWAYAVFTAYQQNAGLEQNLNWAQRPGLAVLLQFVATVHQPFYFQQSSADPAISLLSIPVILVCMTAAIYLFFVEKDSEIELKVLSLFVLLPLTVAFLVSIVSPYSIWGTRHLLVIVAPYFLLVAAGLKRIRPEALRLLCYGILAVMIVPAFAVFIIRPQPLHSWCGWERLIDEVKPEDAQTVYVFEDAVAYDFWYASQTKTEGKLRVILIEDDPDIPEDKAYFLPRGFDGIQKAGEESIAGDKFWIAVRNIWDNEEHPLWKRIKAKGYRLGPALRLKTADAFVFLVPVQKEN